MSDVKTEEKNEADDNFFRKESNIGEDPEQLEKNDTINQTEIRSRRRLKRKKIINKVHPQLNASDNNYAVIDLMTEKNCVETGQSNSNENSPVSKNSSPVPNNDASHDTADSKQNTPRKRLTSTKRKVFRPAKRSGTKKIVGSEEESEFVGLDNHNDIPEDLPNVESGIDEDKSSSGVFMDDDWRPSNNITNKTVANEPKIDISNENKVINEGFRVAPPSISFSFSPQSPRPNTHGVMNPRKRLMQPVRATSSIDSSKPSFSPLPPAPFESPQTLSSGLDNSNPKMSLQPPFPPKSPRVSQTRMDNYKSNVISSLPTPSIPPEVTPSDMKIQGASPLLPIHNLPEDATPELCDRISSHSSPNVKHFSPKSPTVDKNKISKSHGEEEEGTEIEAVLDLSNTGSPKHKSNQVGIPLDVFDRSKVDFEKDSFETYVCSLESFKVYTRHIFKMFKGTEVLYSVKIKRALADGNISLCNGGTAHIKNENPPGTIIVANEKSDYSLRRGNFTGKELLTIRTNRSKCDTGKYSIFVHDINHNQFPVSLLGKVIENHDIIEFRNRNKFKELWASVVVMSKTTVQISCVSDIDAMRAFTICFGILFSFK